MRCLKIAEQLIGVSIPEAPANLSAEETASAARKAGIEASVAGSVEEALAKITKIAPQARVLICGSLYLAGIVLRDNG